VQSRPPGRARTRVVAEPMTDALQRRDIALVPAANPGAFTLTGTNTWVVGRDPCWIVDPGPALDAHVAAVLAEARRRGGIGGIALTHDHGDHADAAARRTAHRGAHRPTSMRYDSVTGLASSLSQSCATRACIAASSPPSPPPLTSISITLPMRTLLTAS